MWVNRYWFEHISRFGQPWSTVHAGTVARYCLKGIQPSATVLYITRNAQTSPTLKHLSETLKTVSIFWEIFAWNMSVYGESMAWFRQTDPTDCNKAPLLHYVTKSDFKTACPIIDRIVIILVTKHSLHYAARTAGHLVYLHKAAECTKLLSAKNIPSCVKVTGHYITKQPTHPPTNAFNKIHF